MQQYNHHRWNYFGFLFARTQWFPQQFSKCLNVIIWIELCMCVVAWNSVVAILNSMHSSPVVNHQLNKHAYNEITRNEPENTIETKLTTATFRLQASIECGHDKEKPKKQQQQQQHIRWVECEWNGVQNLKWIRTPYPCGMSFLLVFFSVNLE